MNALGEHQEKGTSPVRLRWVKIAKRDRIITGKKQENHENKL